LPPIPPIVPTVVKIVPPPVRKHLPWLLVVAIIGAAAVGFGSSGFGTILQTAPPAGSCALPTPAFCDTFDAPQTNGGRGGALAPVWGASRNGGTSNVFQSIDNGLADTNTPAGCPGGAVHSPNDIQICNGKLVESLDDDGAAGGGLGILAMYPRQPFDIAGRTGKVAFDISDDSNGTHAAWPEFSYTDQPVPVPGPSQIAFTGVLLARNSVNVSLAANSNGCVTVDNIWITANYNMTQNLQQVDGCMQEPAQNSLVLNHVEIRLSGNGVTVFGSDAGTTTMKQLAHASYTTPLTRGLVWMKDVHYNAEKASGDGINQQQHSFAWDNFGFDGPVLPRDVGYELPDVNKVVATADNGQPIRDLGQVVAPNGTATFTFPNVAGVENASGALVEFEYWEGNPLGFTYSANGHANHSLAWPGGSLLVWSQQTIALPIPANELVNGSNTITVTFTGSSNPEGISNVDLILAGAGGGGSGGGSTPVPTATAAGPAATATSVSATATALPTTVPAATSTPTVVGSCTVIATLNGVDTRYTRPMSECSNQ
jgi:hypothetical protein